MNTSVIVDCGQVSNKPLRKKALYSVEVRRFDLSESLLSYLFNLGTVEWKISLSEAFYLIFWYMKFIRSYIGYIDKCPVIIR